MEYFVDNFQLFLLILTRMGGMFAVCPFFSSFLIPRRAKLVLSLFITLIIFPSVSVMGIEVPDKALSYFILLLNELLVGLLIGYLVALIFAAFQLSGQLFSFQMGYGISQVLDPLHRIEIPLVGQFQNLLATMVFLTIKGPHFMIRAVYQSYSTVPVLNIGEKAAFINRSLISLFGDMFLVALQIGFPVIGTLFLVSVSLGLLAKAVPQMNILMLGFPIQIGVGLLVLLITVPFLLEGMNSVLEKTFDQVLIFIHGLGS